MRFRISALIAAVVLAIPAVASAADLIRPLPPSRLPQAQGQWYLRADLGWKMYGTPDTIFNAPTFGPGYVVPGNGELFNETMGNAWAFGGGIGVDPAGPHRFDFTIDYETPSHTYGRLDSTLCGPCYSQ